MILFLSRLCGSLMTRVGQPPVIGEILSGIVLGPTVLGWITPGTMQALFPGRCGCPWSGSPSCV
ncbi:cation:proton antiporter [Synechococcus sp. CBW1004]|nr:cation:proton antiporter [Synechococcus sp. CBW1004]